MSNATYWQKRAVQRLTEAEKYSETQLKEIYKIYNEAGKDIDKMIADVYRNYSKTTGLDKETLKMLLSKSETDKFWKTLEGKGLKEYVHNNYKSRITRLEQLKGQMYERVKEVAQKETTIGTNMYTNVMRNGYNNTIYDTVKGIGKELPFNQLDHRTISQVLDTRWSGKNYSERIWTNTDTLSDKLSDILSRGVITGASQSKMSKDIRDAFGVGKYYADRLVRTETNHFHNQAEYKAYEEMGVEEYVFLATLDSRTSEICQEHDGKRFKMSDKEEGYNFPPLHPNCRSTVIAWLGEEFMPTHRRAGNEIIEYTTYKEYDKNNLANIEGIVGKDNILEIRDNVMYTKSGVNYDLKSLKWLPKEIQEPVINQLALMTEKYPDMLPKGGTTLVDGIDKSRPNTKGYTLKSNKKIYISSKYAGNRTNYITGLEREIKDMFKMPILRKNYDRYTIAHEYGHIIQNSLLKKGKGASPSTMKRDILSIASTQTGLSPSEIAKLMSKYGRSSDEEFFAEAFTMFELGKNSNSNILGRAMKIYLKGVL